MKSKKILIVDDNDLNRKLFENLVGQLYQYESAKNGLEALEKLQKSTFDLILMDIQMPQMDGITAMKKIKLQPNIPCPVLAVTAFAEESERMNFLEQGFDDFITKPIRPREFLQVLQKHLHCPLAEAQEPEISESAGILDKALLAQLFKYNSKEAIKKVFEDFLAECELTKQLLEDPQTDSQTILENIHSLKGNSGTLGINKIYLLSQKAESCLRNKELENWNQIKKELKNEMEEFRIFFNQETIFES